MMWIWFLICSRDNLCLVIPNDKMLEHTLGTPDQGTCTQVSQIIGLLQAPSRTCMYLGLQGVGKCV